MKRLSDVYVREIALACVIGICAVALVGNLALQTKRLVAENLLTRYRYNGVATPVHTPAQLMEMARSSSFQPLADALVLSSAVDGGGVSARALINVLRGLSDWSAAERARSAVVVPKTQTRFYWGPLLERSIDSVLPACASTPFLVPAVAGIALLDGLPAVGCEAHAYGYQYYPGLSDRDASARRTLRALCARAADHRIDRLLVVTLAADVDVDVVECATGKEPSAKIENVQVTGPRTTRGSPAGVSTDSNGISGWSTLVDGENADSISAAGSEGTLVMEISTHPATGRLLFPFAVGPLATGLSLHVETIPDGEVVDRFRVPAETGGWALWSVDLGGRSGGRYRLVVRDEDATPGAWVAVGYPRETHERPFAAAGRDAR